MSYERADIQGWFEKVLQTYQDPTTGVYFQVGASLAGTYQFSVILNNNNIH